MRRRLFSVICSSGLANTAASASPISRPRICITSSLLRPALDNRPNTISLAVESSSFCKGPVIPDIIFLMMRSRRGFASLNFHPSKSFFTRSISRSKEFICQGLD